MMLKSICVIGLCLFATRAVAGDHSVKIGPAIVGRGGTNPVSIPPLNPIDWEYTYVSQNKIETNIALFPGILVGARLAKKNLYIAGGGGFVIDSNGIGPGVYNSFGYITGDAIPGWHFNFEYKQTIGYSPSTKQIISPGALRIGIIWQ